MDDDFRDYNLGDWQGEYKNREIEILWGKEIIGCT